MYPYSVAFLVVTCGLFGSVAACVIRYSVFPRDIERKGWHSPFNGWIYLRRCSSVWLLMHYLTYRLLVKCIWKCKSKTRYINSLPLHYHWYCCCNLRPETKSNLLEGWSKDSSYLASSLFHGVFTVFPVNQNQVRLEWIPKDLSIYLLLAFC